MYRYREKAERTNLSEDKSSGECRAAEERRDVIGKLWRLWRLWWLAHNYSLIDILLKEKGSMKIRQGKLDPRKKDKKKKNDFFIYIINFISDVD